MLTVPATAASTATVVFLHGLGQTNSSWLPVVHQLRKELPHVKWILPQADTGPVTLNQGAHRPRWFDVHTLPPGEDEDSTLAAEASMQRIQGILEGEIRDGLPDHRIFFVGFSQGSAMALVSGLTSKHSLGGIAILSGWLPPKLRQIILRASRTSCPPLFWAHGDNDIEIPLQNALETMQWLRSFLDVERVGMTFNEYAGLDHNANDEVVRDLTRWLSTIL